MSTTPDRPQQPCSELTAGERLDNRARRDRVAKARVVGGVGLTVLVGAIFVLAQGCGDTSVPAASGTATLTPSTTPETNAPSTAPAATTTLFTPLDTVPETTPPSSIPVATTTTVVLPLRLEPDTNNPNLGKATRVPPFVDGTAFVDAVDAITGWHGLGHELLNDWNSGGTVLIDGPWIESLVECAEGRMFESHKLIQRAADARSSLISAGVPAADISADRVVSQMTIDDSAAFDFEPAEFKFLLLAVCGGLPDEQARVIASM